LYRAFIGVRAGGQGGAFAMSQNIWKKQQFNVICNDCVTWLSIEAQEGRGFQGKR
jgi:hypothetical protein